MKCRVRRNKGFRPINVRLRFDNIVEYECFRALMGDDGATPKTVSRLSGLISGLTGVNLTEHEVEQCLRGMMPRIWKKLPASWEDRQ